MDKSNQDKNATLDLLHTNTDRQITALKEHNSQKAAPQEKRDAMARVNAHILNLTATGMKRSVALATAMAAEKGFQHSWPRPVCRTARTPYVLAHGRTSADMIIRVLIPKNDT